MNSQISVVIPTYNRPEQLADVLKHIFASDVAGFDMVEVIVVDDGSTNSPQPIVESIVPQSPFSLIFLQQKNCGPAEARNNGFRHSTNEIVLFIDDDILVLPDLIKAHLKAHMKLGDAVVFGRSPFIKPDPATPSYRHLVSLDQTSANEYDLVTVVASGNLSVKKSMFTDGFVYNGNLRIPVSEEFELEQRLNQMSIPIYIANNAIGWHLQPSTIIDKCMQEFKYGVGSAEVFLKTPGAMHNKHLSGIVLPNGYFDPRNDTLSLGLKKTIKRILSVHPLRVLVLRITGILEKLTSSENLLFPIYRYLCGVHLFAGVRKGLKQFKT